MKKAEIVTALLPYPDKGDRKIRIYVPEHNEGELLPVIYMTDGQNLFFEEEATFGCWKLIDLVEAEIKSSGSGAVIVGIDHGGKWRDNELTPGSIGTVMPTDMPCYTNAEGEIFDSFVVDTVMPYIESNFPVRRDREATAFCGSSSGGLQSFFTGLSHRERFSFLGVFSPAFLLYSAEDLKSWISKMITDDQPYLYIYTGAEGDLERRIYESVEVVYDILTELCYPYDLLNEVVLFENEHNEEAWREIFRDFLHTFLFRANKTADE